MENLTIYNANYLKFHLDNGTVSYIQEQEYCDIWWRTPEDRVVWNYYMFRDSKRTCFNYRAEDKAFYCDVLVYGHDWGKIWTEVE